MLQIAIKDAHGVPLLVQLLKTTENFEVCWLCLVFRQYTFVTVSEILFNISEGPILYKILERYETF